MRLDAPKTILIRIYVSQGEIPGATRNPIRVSRYKYSIKERMIVWEVDGNPDQATERVRLLLGEGWTVWIEETW